MTPLVSVLHPTLGRPEKAFERMRQWMERAWDQSRIEYIVSTHTNDMTAPLTRKLIMDREPGYWLFGNVVYTTTPKLGSAANCQNAAERAMGLLLLNAADDCEPPHEWDRLLINRLVKDAGPDWYAKPIFMAVSDGYRKDRLCTMSVETRKYTEYKGHFLYPEYPGIFSDDEATYVAYRDAKDGKIQLIEAKDIVFRHAHPSNDPSVPMDDTYRHQNRPEAYTAGLRLFFERNPRAATDGIRTW